MDKRYEDKSCGCIVDHRSGMTQHCRQHTTDRMRKNAAKRERRRTMRVRG
jgi:hypothetical protein